MPLSPGTRLGAYEVTARIGAGGMGEVWRARDTKLRRDVALKVLPEAFAGDPERISRLRREAQALAARRDDETVRPQWRPSRSTRRRRGGSVHARDDEDTDADMTKVFVAGSPVGRGLRARGHQVEKTETDVPQAFCDHC